MYKPLCDHVGCELCKTFVFQRLSFALTDVFYLTHVAAVHSGIGYCMSVPNRKQHYFNMTQIPGLLNHF